MPDCNCSDCRYNRSPAGRARTRRYIESEKGRARRADYDATWYAAGGWYAQTKSKLSLRIDENRQRLESWTLETQD